MANETLLRGNCVAPFYDASSFPSEGGFIEGRFCAEVTGLLPGNPLCCLPCPSTEWAYSDSFETYGTVAEWLNVVGLILMVFMLISYIVLPAQKTRSHYLSVCLIVSVLFIALGFTIPLAAKPDQCYNEITPNDMYSLSECAWSGAFIIAGGLSATMWIFIRAFSMNLQICFDIVPGKKFFYISQALGWGVPAALFAATVTVTGVSFRFGSACHVNHKNSMEVFWGPLLGLAGAAGILQLVTFGYCIHVYLRNLWSDQAAASSTHGSSAELPSYTSSVRTQTARAVYQRLKKVLWLQWRGISIVTIILVDVIFFSIVFVYLDGLQTSLKSDWQKVRPWLLCLALNPTDKNRCIHMVSGWLVNEPTVVAVLLLLSLAGVQVFLFLTRPSIFPAWYDFFREKLSPRHEFVSLDARPDNMRLNSEQQLVQYDCGHQNTTFEMQKPQLKSLDMELDSKSPSTILSSPDEAYQSPLVQSNYGTPEMLNAAHGMSPTQLGHPSFPPEYNGRVTPDASNPLGSPSPPPVSYNAISLHRQNSDYYVAPQQQRGYQRSPDSVDRHDARFSPSFPGRESEERRYRAPVSSFSGPRSPSRQSSQQSRQSVTFATDPRGRGGLALNPPSEAGESQEDLSREEGPYSNRR